MRKAFDKRLREAGIRCGANLLLGYLGAALLCAGLAAAVAVAAERLLGLDRLDPYLAGLLCGAALAVSVVLWAVRRPRRMQLAVMIDERLALRERFSTALALADSDDAFARAAVHDAHVAAGGVRLRGRFPVRASLRWGYAGGAWALAAGLFLLMPTMDLLGYSAERSAERKRLAELASAKVDVRQAASRIEASVRQLGDTQLAEDLARLSQMKESPKADLRRQAIRKLGDLSDKLDKMRTGPRSQSAKALREMLKGLRGTPKGLEQKLNNALAAGELGKAAEILKDLQEQLKDGKLSKEQREALAGQLKDLGKQLDELAEKQEQLADALAGQGLDKSLASMSDQDLREALKKAGLSDEQIEKLMAQARACRQGGANCKQLAGAMSLTSQGLLAGESVPVELVELAEQLDQLEGALQQAALMAATAGQIEDAIALLGAGQARGQGLNLGMITNLPNARGRGQAWGTRPTDEGGKTGLTKTRAKSKTLPGPVVASWYFRGPQVRGEARRELKKMVQAARDSAAEAVSENEIPRKYEETVKKYFDGLQGSAGED